MAHYPGRPPIDAYGGGGFRFASMSHKGSILILPSGVYDWAPTLPVQAPGDFAALLAERGNIGFVLLGTGKDMLRPSRPVREAFAAEGLALDFMSTGAAVRTWNVLVAEDRNVACALVAVEDAW
jgi:uncharacterized protein